MRLPERTFGLLLLLAGALASSVSRADAIDLKPFKATYTAEWKGVTAGTTVLELRRAGPDTFSYRPRATPAACPHGVFRHLDPTARSVCRRRSQPLTFRGIDEKERESNLNSTGAA